MHAITARHRALILLAIVGVLGALVRFGGFLPHWLAKYSGDAVWASAWVFALLAIWPRLGRRAMLLALAICFSIEVFQLTGIPAMLASEGFVFRLVLGSTFGWWEFPAYFLGVIATVPFMAEQPCMVRASTL